MKSTTIEKTKKNKNLKYQLFLKLWDLKLNTTKKLSLENFFQLGKHLMVKVTTSNWY